MKISDKRRVLAKIAAPLASQSARSSQAMSEVRYYRGYGYRGGDRRYGYRLSDPGR
jgi:hypothetical protein